MALVSSAESEVEVYKGVNHVLGKNEFVKFVECIDDSRGSLGLAGL